MKQSSSRYAVALPALDGNRGHGVPRVPLSHGSVPYLLFGGSRHSLPGGPGRADEVSCQGDESGDLYTISCRFVTMMRRH